MKFYAAAGWAVMLAAGYLPAAIADEPIAIRPKFTAGATNYLEITQEGKDFRRGGMFGPEGTTTNSSRIRGLLQKVEKTGPQGTELTLTFDRMQMKSEGRRGPLSYDSDVDPPAKQAAPTSPDGPRPNMLAPIFSPMVGMSASMKLDAQGQPVSVSGMEAVFEKVDENSAGNFLVAQMHDDFTDESVKLLFGDARFTLFPDKPVKPGDTWKHTVSTNGTYLGDYVLEYACKLEKFGEENGRKIATITYDVDIRHPEGARKGSRMFNMLLRLESGKLKGTATIDVERGELTSLTEEGEIKIKGLADGPNPGETEEVTTDRTVKQTLRIMSEAERKAQKEENKKNAATTTP